MADQRTTLGEIIRRQRELGELSMRQFAAWSASPTRTCRRSSAACGSLRRRCSRRSRATWTSRPMRSTSRPGCPTARGGRDVRRPGRDPRGQAAQPPPAAGAARDLRRLCRRGAPAPAPPRGAGGEGLVRLARAVLARGWGRAGGDERVVDVEHDLALAGRERGIGRDRGRHRVGALSSSATAPPPRRALRRSSSASARSTRPRARTAPAARARSVTGTGWRSPPAGRTGASRAG